MLSFYMNAWVQHTKTTHTLPFPSKYTFFISKYRRPKPAFLPQTTVYFPQLQLIWMRNIFVWEPRDFAPTIRQLRRQQCTYVSMLTARATFCGSWDLWLCSPAECNGARLTYWSPQDYRGMGILIVIKILWCDVSGCAYKKAQGFYVAISCWVVSITTNSHHF